MGTGCISPGAQLPATFFAAREAGFGPSRSRSKRRHVRSWRKLTPHPQPIRWSPTETCVGYAVQSRSGCLVGLALCGFAVQPFTAALAFFMAGDHHVVLLFAVFSLLVENLFPHRPLRRCRRQLQRWRISRRRMTKWPASSSYTTLIKFGLHLDQGLGSSGRSTEASARSASAVAAMLVMRRADRPADGGAGNARAGHQAGGLLQSGGVSGGSAGLPARWPWAVHCP
jgi:hypothetical protein